MKQLVDRVRAGVNRYVRKITSQRRLIDGTGKFQTADVYKIHTAVKNYVRSEACDRLGISRKSAPVLEMPLLGTDTLVWFLRAGGKGAVIRVYTVEKRAEADLHRQISELLASHDVNSPRLLHFCDDIQRFNSVITLEEFIEGGTRTYTGFSDSEIVISAQQLAKLHSIHNPRWGKPGAERNENLFNSLTRRIEHNIEIAREKGLHSSPDDFDVMRRWFQTWEKKFGGITHFSFIHGDMHRGNGIFTDEGKFYLIDFGDCLWGMPALDLVTVHRKICAGKPDQVKAFNEAYFQTALPEDRALAQKFLPFYEASARLGRVAVRSKRIKDPELIETEYETKKDEWHKSQRTEDWNTLMKICRSNQPNG